MDIFTALQNLQNTCTEIQNLGKNIIENLENQQQIDDKNLSKFKFIDTINKRNNNIQHFVKLYAENRKSQHHSGS